MEKERNISEFPLLNVCELNLYLQRILKFIELLFTVFDDKSAYCLASPPSFLHVHFGSLAPYIVQMIRIVQENLNEAVARGRIQILGEIEEIKRLLSAK